MFHLKDITRASIKECVIQIQENVEFIQTIFLLDPKELQKESQKHNTSYVHLGCIRVGISTLTHIGLNTFVLATIKDLSHNKYIDSLLEGIIAPLSNGPVWFDCYPNFCMYVFDEHIKDILQLQIKTSGFDMKRKRTNIFIHTRGFVYHTNTLYLVVLHAPSKDSK